MNRPQIVVIAALAIFLGTARSSLAAKIAVFGDNSIDNFLNARSGISATLVTDKNLANPGFLDSFDAFIYTRNASSFGAGLSAAAAANVKSFVTGNVILFMTDLADKIGPKATDREDALANKALLNAVSFATQNGKGFIGEFGGAGMALSNNTSGYFGGQALGLLPGTFTGFNYSPIRTSNILQPNHPVTAGLPNPWSITSGQDFLVGSVDIPPEFVVAVGANSYPTIAATSPVANLPVPNSPQSVPEPTTGLGLLAIGAFGVGSILKRLI